MRQTRINRIALVTGASSGIGLEIARLLSADRYDLILTARDQARLETAASQIRAETDSRNILIPADLSQANGAADLYEQVHARGLAVDVLVNNAGMGVYGPFLETSLESESAIMRLNMMALTELTKYFLPHMTAQRSGRILNVASTAAFQAGPFMAVYYATKAYVLSFSEALANELEGTGVTVTVLCPGPTETEFVKKASMAHSKLFRNQLVWSAADVAREGVRAMNEGRPIVITGWRNRAVVAAGRLLPRRMITRIIRKVQEPA